MAAEQRATDRGGLPEEVLARLAALEAELAENRAELQSRVADLEAELAGTQAELAEAKRQLNLAPGGVRDWAGGLPAEVLKKVAEKVVAQTEAEWAAWLKVRGRSRRHHRFGIDDDEIQEVLEERKRDGNCLLVFALVCKEWRKAQLKVGGRLCTRVDSDVIMPGGVALAKWALAEGCPRKHHQSDYDMAWAAADRGHLEMVRWLCEEGGFAMERRLMWHAAQGGNLELVQWLCNQGCPWDHWTCCGAAGSGNLEVLQWLRAEGCPWDYVTCVEAVTRSHVDILRWARENGCPWHPATRNWAARKLGYKDDFGNLQAPDRTPMSEDDPYTDCESDDGASMDDEHSSSDSYSHSESDDE